MEKNIKKLVTLLLVITLIVSLAGCGVKDNDTSKNDDLKTTKNATTESSPVNTEKKMLS